MTFTLIYWMLMLLWLVLGLAPSVRAKTWPSGFGVLLFLLFLLLGWEAFGAPVKT